VIGYADLLEDSETMAGDARRIANATAHCRGLLLGMLSVHAVAMVRDGEAVVLFGGHGAGKSVTGLALAERGWIAVAGDMALIQVGGHETRPLLVGGSRQYLLRPASFREWFGSRGQGRIRAGDHGTGVAARIDITHALGWAEQPAGEIVVCAAVLVTVDSGAGPIAEVAVMDNHTSASVWYRASSHLVDRVLDDEDAEPLRCMEAPALAVARMTLIREAARALPVRSMFGTPRGIAEAAEACVLAGARG